MSSVDQVYQKYSDVFLEVNAGQAWVDLAAVRYALRAALRELAATTEPPTTGDRIAENHYAQIQRLNKWLEQNAPGYFNEGNTADATIDELDSLKRQTARLRIELATAIEERDAADRDCAELERQQAQQRIDLKEELRSAYSELNTIIAERDGLRQQLAQMDADNAKLVQELATLRSYAVATPTSNGKTAIHDTAIHDMASTLAVAVLSQAASDYWIGLEAGRWTWRQIPDKSAKLEIIRHVIMLTEHRSQSEFNAARPSWLPTATAHCGALDVSWAELIDLSHEVSL